MGAGKPLRPLWNCHGTSDFVSADNGLGAAPAHPRPCSRGRSGLTPTEIMDIKLSICIPTYNRAALLGQTLENVLAQVASRADVEVVVSDNASPDDTQEVIRTYQACFPRLTYFRQPENLGADRNYLKVVSLAQGEYCWLLGDDDLIEENAVALLLDVYLIQPIHFMQLCVTGYDFHMEKVLDRSSDVLGVTEDFYTTDALSYFAQFFRESFFSGFVINRSMWNGVDPTKYIGTDLTFLAIAYEYLQPDSPVRFVARPMVKYRSGNPYWSSSTLEILVGNMNYVLNSLPERYDPFKDEAGRGYKKRLPMTLSLLAGLRAKGYYDLPRYQKYMSSYFADRPWHKSVAYLLAVTPVGVIKRLSDCRKALR